MSPFSCAAFASAMACLKIGDFVLNDERSSSCTPTFCHSTFSSTPSYWFLYALSATFHVEYFFLSATHFASNFNTSACSSSDKPSKVASFFCTAAWVFFSSSRVNSLCHLCASGIRSESSSSAFFISSIALCNFVVSALIFAICPDSTACAKPDASISPKSAAVLIVSAAALFTSACSFARAAQRWRIASSSSFVRFAWRSSAISRSVFFFGANAPPMSASLSRMKYGSVPRAFAASSRGSFSFAQALNSSGNSSTAFSLPSVGSSP